ncbi:lipopolysaccharide biosynthesis protein [Peribacillus butanolivorans]|uniref:lipopolysaccharide biosynthesis protein n=1 Tax=Peribacillus butanolivorans TaxID=421767 RepID=UPI003670F3FA
MRTKKALITSLIAFVSLFIKSVANFLVIRLFIQTFGNEMNGIVATAGQMLEYLNVLDGGLGVAVVTMLLSPLSKGDYIKANKIIIAANKFYKKIGILFYLFLFCLAYIYSYWGGQEFDAEVVFWLIILAGAVNFPNFFILPGFNFLLMADQREYMLYFFNMLSSLIGPALMIFAMNQGSDVYVVRLIPVIMNFLVAICIRIYAANKYKWLNINGDTDVILRNQAKDMILHRISGLIVFNTDMIVLSIATDFSQVSKYSIYLSIYFMVKNIIAPIIASGRIGLGQIMVEGNLLKAQKIFSTFEYISFLIIFIFLTTLSIITVPFIKIYSDGLNGLQYSDMKLNLLFVIVFLMDLLRNPHQSVINVAGHFKQTKYRALTEALLNVSFSIIFVNLYGIYGVLYGTIIAYSYRVIDIIIYSCRKILNISIRKTSLRIVRNLTTAIIITLLGIYTFPIIDNIFVWILYSGLYFICITIIFCTINIIFEKNPFIDFIYRFIPRKFNKTNNF